MRGTPKTSPPASRKSRGPGELRRLRRLAAARGAQTLVRGRPPQPSPRPRDRRVGADAPGQSAVLRLLAGEEPAPEGALSTPTRLRIAVLRQDHFRFETTPIHDVVM